MKINLNKKFTVFIYSGILGVIAILIISFLGRGGLLHYVGVMALEMYVGIPLAVLTIILFLAVWLKKSLALRKAAKAVLAIDLFILILLLSLPVGEVISRNDLSAAKNFCESLIPAIESYKTKTDHYPKQWSQIAQSNTSLPALLKNSKFYQGQENTFSFYFGDPKSMMGFYYWSSEEKIWRYGD